MATKTAGIASTGTKCGKSTGNCDALALFGGSQGLKYAEYGAWVRYADTTVTDYAVFSTGTPTATMPKSGTASYTGEAQGIAGATNQPGGPSWFGGTLKLAANFAKNTISGGISGIKTTNVSTNAAGTLNDIAFSNGVISGKSFSGTAAAAATAGGTTPSVAISGASGRFGGSFYGPSAAEAAGTFRLSGGPGGTLVIGSFGAHK